jgi:hypothetical protein
LAYFSFQTAQIIWQSNLQLNRSPILVCRCDNRTADRDRIEHRALGDRQRLLRDQHQSRAVRAAAPPPRILRQGFQALIALLTDKLTEDQAWEVLQQVDNVHDAEWGINWTTLETVADDLYPAPDDEKEA